MHRFLQLRGQGPIDQRTNTISGLQARCFHLVSEIQKICWSNARQFEASDMKTTLFTNEGGRTEDHILFRTRSCTLNDMDEDTLVCILLVFMLGNSVTRGPGVDFRWCPLTHQIRLTSCAVTEVTVRRSPFNLTRREVFFDHQSRG